MSEQALAEYCKLANCETAVLLTVLNRGLWISGAAMMIFISYADDRLADTSWVVGLPGLYLLCCLIASWFTPRHYCDPRGKRRKR